MPAARPIGAISLRAIVESLQRKKALERGLGVARAVDVLWTLNHPNVWQLLVRERGWTPAQYERWYGFTHPRPDGLADWSYGLPEVAAPAGRLVANPGCYATAALLALHPIRDAIDPSSVVVDAKSGMTGAGRSLKQSSHAGFVLENLSPYAVGSHRHAPEIAQQLGFPVCFVPHLLPVKRGILTALYVKSAHAPADLAASLRRYYEGSPFVHVVDGAPPRLSEVVRTNDCRISVHAGSSGRAVLFSALDNLVKGAAGQAIQNLNLAMGWSETSGLPKGGR